MTRPGVPPDPDRPEDPAWGWVEHLRAGGTTPWLGWLSHPGSRTLRDGLVPRRPLDAANRGGLPGAAQLELVRRLAERAGGADPAAFTRLADLALGRPAPGRGMPDLPLLRPEDGAGPGARDSGSVVGAPATDPTAVPTDELIRPGVGLLADLLVRNHRESADGSGVGAPEAPRHARRWPWARAFRLVGAPVTVAVLRASLRAAGHREGGQNPQVLVLVEPLDVHLAQVWSMRVQHGSPAPWPRFVGRWAARDRVPPSAYLTRTAALWADRVGRDRLRLVAGPDPERAVADLLRVDGIGGGGAAGDPAPLPGVAVDLLRRLNSVLSVRLPDDERRGVLRRAVGLLPGPDGPPLRVPDRHRAWLDDRARTLADGLSRDGYAVHGDLARVAPRHTGRTQPRRGDVLSLVLDTCLRLAGTEGAE